MEVEDIKVKYADEISVIRQASKRSWLWAAVATVLAITTMTLVNYSGLINVLLGAPGALAAVSIPHVLAAGVAGMALIAAGRGAVSVDVDRDIQIEDINARRSAEYGAKAMVKELEEAGVTMEVKPKDAAQAQPNTQIDAQREHITRLQTISLIKSQ